MSVIHSVEKSSNLSQTENTIHGCILFFSFDILVNGGGSVTLMFQRQPFQFQQTTVMVPWNQMVTMDTVTMLLERESIAGEDECVSQVEHGSIKPIVLSTWQHTQLGSCPSRSTIIPESQVGQHTNTINLAYSILLAQTYLQRKFICFMIIINLYWQIYIL